MRLLGEFVVSQGGQAVTGLDAPRMQALLAYLALRRDTLPLRQQLAFALWPDSDEGQARTNLRNLLHRLRQSWPAADQYLAVETKSIGWQPGISFTLDTAEFEQAIQQAQTAVSPHAALPHWQRAIDLYRQDLLPSCYDDWIAPERARLRQLFLQALETTIQLLIAQQAYQRAVPISRQLIAAEPLHEAAYRQLMALHVQLGDRAAALRIYYQCAAVLQRELAVDPAPETQDAYRRLLALDANVPIPTPAPLLQTSLVGRRLEWTQLTAVWQQMMAGQRPPLILIGGNAGVGKTRLAEEFGAWVRRQGGVTAVAACYAAETQLAFGPVASWLRTLSLAGLDPIWQSELARLLPELTPLDAASPPITEAWQKRRFYEAVAQAVEAQKLPLCLLLEDVQWADGETLAWLHYLLRREGRAGLLLVATWRPEEAEGAQLAALLRQWREQGRLREMELAPLDATETADLAATLLGAPLPVQLAAWLQQQTEGNPLFVVETLHHALAVPLANKRALHDLPPSLDHLSQMLQPAGGETVAPLPPKMLAVIKARLAQLSASAYSLAEAASVIGRSFTIPVLQQVSGMAEDGLITAVDEMWRRRIVRDQEGDVYDFTHGKLRQVAYQTISPARRRWLHGRVAQALVAQDTGHEAGLAGRIAFHYEAAGQAERAFAYHRQAAAAARQVYANQEEVFHMQQAIDLHGRALAAPALLVTLYEQLGDAHTVLGQHDAARQAYTMALAALPLAQQTAQAVLTLKLAKNWLARYELDAAQQLFAQIAHLLGEPTALTAAEWRIWLDARLEQFDVAYYAANLPQMAALVAETEPLLTRHGDVRQRIRFYQTRAQWHSRQTRFRHTDEGVADTRTALQLAQETSDESLVHSSRFGLGFMLLWQATPDPATAAAELEQAAAGARAVGNVPLLDRCLAYLTTAYRLLGNEEKVLELLPQSTAVAESEENELYLGVAQAHRAWLAARAGRWAEALAEARVALAQWQSLVFPFHWLACWPALAAAVALGDWETAVAQAQAMLASAQQQLPAAIEAALTQASTQPKPAHFQYALTLARQHNML